MSSEKNYPVVDSAESFEALLEQVRQAQRVFAGYTQERVDAIFQAAGPAADRARGGPAPTAPGVFARPHPGGGAPLFRGGAPPRRPGPDPPGQAGRGGDRHGRGGGQGHQEPLRRRIHLQRL